MEVDETTLEIGVESKIVGAGINGGSDDVCDCHYHNILMHHQSSSQQLIVGRCYWDHDT
jgi:hypothetical protein